MSTSVTAHALSEPLPPADRSWLGVLLSVTSSAAMLAAILLLAGHFATVPVAKSVAADDAAAVQSFETAAGPRE